MYVGTFENTKTEQYGDIKILIPTNEFDEEYFSLRENRKEKYVVLTDVNPPHVIRACDAEGAFSFAVKQMVYFEDFVPEGAVDMNVRYTFDGKEFKRYYDVRILKYNANYEVTRLLNKETDQDKIAQIKAFAKAADEYEGDGSDFPKIEDYLTSN
ncbi:hypothetical protein [Pantoea stewartii]|uniref:hypothetical protein n=1 Tax=Pantoea stewartii TaxID=66269 RepID=UPI00197F1DA3|nr:hypothetical protein [Pantoea stewartii]